MGLAETDGDTDQNEVNDDPIGCYCSDGCLSSTCSCVSLGYSSGGSCNCNHYSSDGRITSWKKFIVECDSSCSCGSSCANRVVQRGSALRLFVSQTEPNEQLSSSIGSDSGSSSSATLVDKGLGLYTCESIAAGTFVTEYCGELLSTEEAMRRLSQQPLTAHNYLLVMREHYTFGDSAQSHCSTNQSAYAYANVNVTCIDATHIGSRARFVNHTCARDPPPPLVLVPIRTRSQFGCSSASALCDSDAGAGVVAVAASQQQHNLIPSRSAESAIACSPSSSNSSSSTRICHSLPLPPARAALFAARDIAAGEELLFDYSAIVGVGEESAQRSQQTEDTRGTPSGNRVAAGSSSRPCLCQSRECRGALPFDPLAFSDSYRSSASASSCSDSRI